MNKCFAVICLLVVAGWSVQAGATSYTAIDLGDLRGQSLNDNGQIAGVVIANGAESAAIRQADGTVTYVPSMWDSRSWAHAISNTGYVAGMCGPAAFRWNGVTAPQQLDGPGLKDAPYAINDQGIVAGWSADSSYNERAVIWKQNGEMEVIPGLSGDSLANDINNAGQVIGQDSRGSFLWSESTGLKYLGFTAQAINNNGWIVGNDFYGKVVLRKPNGSIDTLEIPSLLTNWSAWDINDIGQILAWNAHRDGSHNGILWNPDGSILDLGPGRPTVLNNNGQVLGRGYDSMGYEHYILWQPVPEPSSILALLCGIGSLGGMIRRKKTA